ncbi:MAG: 2-oxoacid:acceptor oxidoreductase family protein [bacterium]|nr:2-oxoacid:acceptor oxidoreductase family protein [bacterium]
MNLEVIMAGFGGQGVMLMGQLLTYAGMLDGKQVSWMPSYGPEMRGGTANCTVIISDSLVGSPVVTTPGAVVAMSLPSMDKFEASIKPGGIMIYNSSLISRAPLRNDITYVSIPANDIATDLGNNKVANIVMLGALLKLTQVVTIESVEKSFLKAFPAHRHNLIPLNLQALNKGLSL